MQGIQYAVVLSPTELKFVQELRKGEDVSKKYKPVYIRTLKHRILKKHRQLTVEALMISEVLDRLNEL